VGRFDDVFWIRTTHRIPLTVWGFCGIYVHTQSYRYLWKLCRATSESVVRQKIGLILSVKIVSHDTICRIV
jgi:hypothetical protein